MESDTDNLMQVISGTLSRRRDVGAVFASAMTLLLYDWSLTLPQEVEYIWRASWNWSKVLYLLTRYIPFATITVNLRNHFSPNPKLESCNMGLHAIVWLTVIGLDLAEVVLAVRTWAVWIRDKRVGIGLALLLGLYQIPHVIIWYRFIQGDSYTENPYPELFNGCFYINSARILFAEWVALSIVDGVVLVLMIISAVKTCRPLLLDGSSLWTITSWTEHKSNLLNVVYRDGICFYLYIFCASLANVLITLLLPVDFVGSGSIIEVVLHSILTCRLMIGIRKANQSCGRNFELSQVPCHSTLQFARSPLGECPLANLEDDAGPSRT